MRQVSKDFEGWIIFYSMSAPSAQGFLVITKFDTPHMCAKCATILGDILIFQVRLVCKNYRKYFAKCAMILVSGSNIFDHDECAKCTRILRYRSNCFAMLSALSVQGFQEMDI